MGSQNRLGETRLIFSKVMKDKNKLFIYFRATSRSNYLKISILR